MSIFPSSYYKSLTIVLELRLAEQALLKPLFDPTQVQLTLLPGAGKATVDGLGLPDLHNALLPNPVAL